MKSMEYRKQLSQIIRRMNKEIGSQYGHKMTLKKIDSFTSIPRFLQRESKDIIYKNLQEQIFISNLALQCLTSISMAITDPDDNRKPLFPKDWIDRSGLPNTDFVVRSFITQIVNYSLSILTLVEKGLDNPARALLRSTNELIWQSLVLIYRRDYLKQYCKGQTEQESRKIWKSLFGQGKLLNRLKELEEGLGFPNDLIEPLKKSRIKSQVFYSQTIHHSYNATTIGSYSPDFETDIQHFALLGCASVNSRSTLRNLNHQLRYFLILFYRILLKHHELSYPMENNDWYEAFVCHNCMVSLYPLIDPFDVRKGVGDK